jgi:hypothetical protein
MLQADSGQDLHLHGGSDLPGGPPAAPSSSLVRDIALGLLLCLLVLCLILFASGDSGAERGFIYVDF